MKMCQTHWDALKKSITARGLTDFIPSSGMEATDRTLEQLKGKQETQQNFDPLMSANNMIWGNSMDYVRSVGGNPLVMLNPPEDHPEWECPICFLNFLSEEHDRTCTEPNCKKERGLRFEFWIDKAADGVAEYAKTLPVS